MKHSMIVGLILVSVLLTISLGLGLAELTKDNVNATSPMTINNASENATNSTTITIPVSAAPKAAAGKSGCGS